ncbi:unnamed protein product [Leptidea sinapis]|uniref:Protein Wnt n=1 Tax=Leptidea sinapis TaxID=189913 RepID=A0A5E4QJM8_9NEOP|nr:unnamed protein product [Leptidea sinapis]
MRRGFREAAFLYALTAAGVAHAIARACAQGRLVSCGCDPLGYRTSLDSRGRARPNKWEWSGCSHNLAYGVDFSRKFLDIREKVDDLQSKINVHNNNAGRSILSSHMEVRCKCHGLSGSCQLRTCWRATPDFRIVASTIKRQYRKYQYFEADPAAGGRIGLDQPLKQACSSLKNHPASVKQMPA